MCAVIFQEGDKLVALDFGGKSIMMVGSSLVEMRALMERVQPNQVCARLRVCLCL